MYIVVMHLVVVIYVVVMSHGRIPAGLQPSTLTLGWISTVKCTKSKAEYTVVMRG
jgi:hypothetical protein